MSDTAFQPGDPFDSLLTQLLDNELSDAGWTELRERLATDPTAIDRYLDFLTLHALLEVEVGWQGAIQNHEVDLFADSGPAPTTNLSLNDAMILPAIRDDSGNDDSPEPLIAPKVQPFQVGERSAPKLRIRRVWFLAASLLLAATVIAAITYAVLRNRSQNMELATLTQTLEARWDDTTGQWNAGDVLPSERKLSLKSGWAELSYPNGVELTIEGPARFSVNRGHVLWLDSGKLAAVVPETGHGFTVRTASATVVDLGTEFGVATYDDGRSDVQVFRGRVTVAATISANRQPAATAPVELTEGDARRISADGAVAPVQLAESTFVRPQMFAAWVKADSATPYERWKAFSERMRRDPTLIAYYTFENHDFAPDRLVNYSTAGSALDGVLGGGDSAAVPMWTTGRWPLKGALEFHSGEKQHVSIPPSPALDFSRGDQKAAPFSIAMWVQGTGQWDSAVVTRGAAAAEQYAFGAEPKSYRIWLRDKLPEGRAGTAFDLSGGSDTDGQWHGVVATYDPVNLKLTLYVDGVVAGTLKAPEKLVPTSSEIRIGAREVPAGEAPANLEGSVDEIAIFGRVLTADEVRSMYDAGKPD